MRFLLALVLFSFSILVSSKALNQDECNIREFFSVKNGTTNNQVNCHEFEDAESCDLCCRAAGIFYLHEKVRKGVIINDYGFTSCKCCPK